MSTQKTAIFLIMVCTIFTSTAQILLKFGVKNIDLSNLLSLINVPLILGFTSYGISAILMILAFRKGELSVLYPIFATSYVWVGLVSPYFFPSDSMNLWKWTGISVILISVAALGLGSSKVEVQHG